MKTIFLSIFDGDTERVMLRTGVFDVLKASGHRIVLLIRGVDRMEYYRNEYGSEQVLVELLPPAGSMWESFWYYIGWNSIPTHAVTVRRKREYVQTQDHVRYAIFSLFGIMTQVRIWREFLRVLYRWFGEEYAKDLFDRFKPDLLFAPNMFSPEDLRLLRMAKKRGIPTVTTAKSWDVLTTKAFTRVKADRILVFNEYNRDEAIRYGDYRPEQVEVVGFPQFDIYDDEDVLETRKSFCARMGIDPAHRIVLFGVPGDWKSPYTKDILLALDAAIAEGRFAQPVTVIARLHPKYPDASEGREFAHIRMERPGTYFNAKRGFSIDSGSTDQFSWTFRREDIEHLANELCHSDALVVTDSTLALDAAAVGRPTIIIGYDGGHQVPYWKSITSIYERDHYRNLLALNATPFVRSHDELIAAMKACMDDPTHLQREREELARRFLHRRDGHSGERMGTAVLAALPP